MIKLFEHNQIAYDAVLSMLKETGKAAVIHPTGTGKSFIAFKLAEENPSACFCWLSPSEYIYKTQVENLKKASGTALNNIQFYTYARLMLMDDSQRRQIKPDYIILDEFHRCGASEWSKGVDALLADYPHALLLGLTATNIRYLDHQRDMADEIFDGCIAHQMNLGEAIVCGALPAPKYVVSLYSYQKDLERYTRRVRQVGGAAQLACEKYLDQLRRKLERTRGMGAVFEKHMPNRQGKYLVFCSCVEHMQMMLEKASEWFSRIDARPHIYQVYADNASSRQEYIRFCKDDSDHLKLLFCIDMLNEGIHVDDLSGVILFRPTESPIVYKQQIGRALSVSGNRTPVIFDLVNNVDHLYAISALRAEMEEVISYYRNQHRENAIVQSDFEIIDEVRDVRILFEQLEATLSASWDMMYAEAAAFYHANGHLDIPRRYRTEANLALGNWIMTQRTVRRGTKTGVLTQEQIEKLDAIGMVWESSREARWETGYAYAQAYWGANGNLDVPYGFTAGDDSFPLGAWVAQMRALYKEESRGRLNEEQIRKLEAIGMVWHKTDAVFEEGICAAMRFAQEQGHLNVPAAYVSQDGFKLGRWIGQLRQQRDSLSQEQIQRLDQLGMNWQGRLAQRWEQAFLVAQRYFQQHGHLEPEDQERPEGLHLRRWLNQQRQAMAEEKLPEEKRKRLYRIGFSLEKKEPWDMQYQKASAFYKEHGHLDIPKDDMKMLAEWVREQRKSRTADRLSADQIERLNAIGMVWASPRQRQWQAGYEAAREFFLENGHLRVSPSFEDQRGFKLGNWLNAQRKRYFSGKLDLDKIQLLWNIGADWIDEKHSWQGHMQKKMPVRSEQTAHGRAV